jgi:hypothetical protein
LHERISFLYVVDGYLCTLSDHEGERELFTAKGVTLQEALDGLRELVRPYASKEEMKRAAQIRIEAEAIGARVWQAGREISFLPDMEYQSKNRVVRARLSSDKPSVQSIPKSTPIADYKAIEERIKETLKRKKESQRIRELEAVQEQLMADVEGVMNDRMIRDDDCSPDHVTHD